MGDKKLRSLDQYKNDDSITIDLSGNEDSENEFQIIAKTSVLGKTKHYLLKKSLTDYDEGGYEAIAEVLGSAIFRFFLGEDRAPTNKLIINSETNIVNVTSKILPNFKNSQNEFTEYLRKNNIDNNSSKGKFYEFINQSHREIKEVSTVAFLTLHTDLRLANIGFSSINDDKVIVLDFEHTLFNHNTYLNAKPTMNNKKFQECFVSNFFHSFLSHDKDGSLTDICKVIDKIDDIFCSNKGQLREDLAKSFTHIEQYLPESLEELFQQFFFQNYENSNKGAEIIIDLIEGNLIRLNVIEDHIKLQQNIKKHDFEQVSHILNSNPDLLSEKTIWFADVFDHYLVPSYFCKSNEFQSYSKHCANHFAEDPEILNYMAQVTGENESSTNSLL